MFTLIVRAIILYILLLAVFRLMGKRQLGEMQPFELVLTLIIADLACIPMGENTIPMSHGVVPLLSLVVLHFLMTFLCRKSLKLRKLFNGKPVIIIDSEGINYKLLKALNMTVNDLCESLRGCDCFDLNEVAYAIVETNGSLSVLLKTQNAPPSAEDMKIATDEATLNVILINDGKMVKENLEYLGVTEEFVLKIISNKNAKLQDVLILAINGSGEAYFQLKNKKYETITTNLKKVQSV